MSIVIKNKQTKKTEVIAQDGVTQEAWGFKFFVASELEAYKAAYEYRNNKSGVEVSFAWGAGKWMVTVFNEVGASLGFSGSKKS